MKPLMSPLHYLCFAAIVTFVVPVWASQAQTQPKGAEDEKPGVTIYNSDSNGNPQYKCKIELSGKVMSVDLRHNDFGCNNDDAYYVSLENIPSATNIWLLSENDCDLDNAKADWIFKLTTRKKITSTDNMRISGLKLFLDEKKENPNKAVIVTAGVELTGGQIVLNDIDGRLSCVRIESPTPDTSKPSTVVTQPSTLVKGINKTAASPAPLRGELAVINFYGDPSKDGQFFCSMPIKDYVYHLGVWFDDNGDRHGSDDGGTGCPNDDIYAIELQNVPSATRIWLTSEANCNLAPVDSDRRWLFELKTTKQNVSTPKETNLKYPFLQLNDLVGMKPDKVLPPPLCRRVFYKKRL